MVTTAIAWTIVLAAASSASPIDDARNLYRSFEFEAAAQVLETFTEDEPGRSEPSAFLLLGECYAVLGRVSDADAAFVRLLELDPTFDLPASTPPKILLVFRQTRADRDQRVARERAAARQRLVDSIEVDTQYEKSGVGGRPFGVTCDVRDPDGAVRTVRLVYRRDKDEASSALALAKQTDGRWSGAIPAELTENDTKMTIEFRIELHDADQTLLMAHPGGPNRHRAELRAGRVAGPVAVYKTWWFWTAVVGAAAVATTAVVVATRNDPPGDLMRFTFPP